MIEVKVRQPRYSVNGVGLSEAVGYDVVTLFFDEELPPPNSIARGFFVDGTSTIILKSAIESVTVNGRNHHH